MGVGGVSVGGGGRDHNNWNVYDSRQDGMRMRQEHAGMGMRLMCSQ